jgi:hypothetical protein
MGAPLPKTEFQSPSARGQKASTSAGTGKQANLNRNKPHSPPTPRAILRIFGRNSGADKTDKPDIVRPPVLKSPLSDKTDGQDLSHDRTHSRNRRRRAPACRRRAIISALRRATVELLNPTCLATLLIPNPLPSHWRALSGARGSFRGRPSVLPLAIARTGTQRATKNPETGGGLNKSIFGTTCSLRPRLEVASCSTCQQRTSSSCRHGQ